MKFKKHAKIEKKLIVYNVILSDLVNARDVLPVDASVGNYDKKNNLKGYIVGRPDIPEDKWFVNEEYMEKYYKVVK